MPRARIRTKEVQLTLRKIYIVPSALSIAMLLLCTLLLLFAVNFQNSLIYALSFWLFALLVVSVFATYRNMVGLSIKAIRAEPCFAGGKAECELVLSHHASHEKRALQLGWQDEDDTTISLTGQQTLTVKLAHSVSQRGYFDFPSIMINTRYPTGLAVAWSYVALDLCSIVYPQPEAFEHLQTPINNHTEKDKGIEAGQGMTDFGEIRAYQYGDSPRHIHWIKYAQTGNLYSKTFIDYAADDHWLDWDSLTMSGTEQRLSYLCHQVLLLHQQRLPYGLKLPTQTLQPAMDESHKTQCLTALALYGIEDKRVEENHV